MGPTTDETIRLEPYDPGWPERFEEERQRLEETLGAAVVGGIHHVGSTSVPGLAAKPIIDILAGVPSLEIAYGLKKPLEALGYLYAPYRPGEMAWFCKPSPARRTHHLHLVPFGSTRFRAELTFRDYLRAHPEVCEEYAVLKHRLAKEFAQDREGYTTAKADFIREVLDRAAGDAAA